MLFRNVNMSAPDATLEVFPKVFHAVDVRIANHIFVDAVIDGLVIVAASFSPL